MVTQSIILAQAICLYFLACTCMYYVVSLKMYHKGG